MTMRVITLGLWLIFSLNVFAQTCTANDMLKKMTESRREWTLLKSATAQDRHFWPVVKILTTEEQVWIATFRSDFFPVKVSSHAEGLLLENVTFLLPSPAGNGFDELLSTYRQQGVQYVLRVVSGCETKKLKLEVTFPKVGKSKDSEIYFFEERQSKR